MTTATLTPTAEEIEAAADALTECNRCNGFGIVFYGVQVAICSKCQGTRLEPQIDWSFV